MIYRRCLRILRDNSLAEEVVQETFLKVYQNAGKLGVDKSSMGYIYKIAVNNCIDIIRRRKINQNYCLAYKSEDQAIENKEVKILLQQILSGFVQEDQKYIVMYYMDELTQEDIAEILQVSRRTVIRKIQSISKKLELYRECNEQ